MMCDIANLPEMAQAVQLVGPDELVLNRSKTVHRPGLQQIVARVEAVGLCFSDLKLLKQFSAHPRKGEIISGIAPEVLDEIPSYVPGEKPIVPGHEAVCRIVAVGDEVKHHKVGERVLVQTDYRELKTAGSNAAFGYNFEGGLQEYVLLDERVVIEPGTGERFLIPVPEGPSASSICLVEPWACVEDSYVSHERQTPKAGGKMLIVVDESSSPTGLEKCSRLGMPEQVTAVIRGDFDVISRVFPQARRVESLESVTDSFDDIIYFGSQAQAIENLNDRLGVRGIINIVLGGKAIGRDVSVAVGRVHYGMTRWIGTTSPDASESYANIPSTGEIRAGDSILVIGAGGPMGQMHVIRNLCSGISNISMTLTDVDTDRMGSLLERARPIANERGVRLDVVDSSDEGLHDYFALMAPLGELVAHSIKQSRNGAIINIFTGIPAQTRHEIDLDAYIERRCFMFGTSGSVIRDMKIVLDKIAHGTLDTDGSVDAVSGMAGALDGLKAVENRTLAGKIIVYPCLHEMGLVPLREMKRKYPTVAARLENNLWCKSAEEELLKVAK